MTRREYYDTAFKQLVDGGYQIIKDMELFSDRLGKFFASCGVCLNRHGTNLLHAHGWIRGMVRSRAPG